MLYDFDCECGLKLKADFDFGSCPDSIPCECGKTAKSKDVSLPTFQLKGEGWVGKLHA